jgi:hypothetical protein
VAVKTLYLLNASSGASFNGGAMQDGGTAPTAATSSFGWTVAKGAAGFWKARLGATTFVASGNVQATSQIDSQTRPQVGGGNTNANAGDSWVTPARLFGTFANTAWTFNYNMRGTVATPVGRIRTRVARARNADASGPVTYLTSSTLVTNIVTLSSTTADVNATITWSPGALLIPDEFLFFEIEWEETTAGGTTTTAVGFRVGLGSNSVTSSIVTPDFTAGVSPQTPWRSKHRMRR